MSGSSGDVSGSVAPDRVSLVQLPRMSDPRGSLTVLEGGVHVPFALARARWVYGVPPDEARGGHAHHATAQLFVAVAGAVTVRVDDGRSGEQRYRLDAPDRALYVPPLVWVSLAEFAPGTVCVFFASTPFSPADYIRERTAFAGAVAAVAEVAAGGAEATGGPPTGKLGRFRPSTAT